MTQMDLAIALQDSAYTNINPATICKFERGKQKPWCGAIVLMCEYFGMSESELFPELQK